MTSGKNGSGIIVSPTTGAAGGGGTVTGGIVNTGAISVTAAKIAAGIEALSGTVGGGVNNFGTLDVTAGTFAAGIDADNNSMVSAGITNAGMIKLAGGTTGSGIIVATGSTVTGGITNTGAISVSAGKFANGIKLVTSTVAGGLANAGTIGASGGNSGAGIVLQSGVVSGGITNTGAIAANGNTGLGILISAGSTVTGGIVNSGAISTSAGKFANGIEIVMSELDGGISNAGVITASAPNGEAVGIRVGIRNSGLVSPVSFPDGITNTGSITASGKTGIGILSATPIQGGIRNTGTVIGSTAAIDLTLEAGGSTVINQEAGALIGDVKLSANADVLNFTGGLILNAVTAPSGNQDVVNISGQNATFASTASVNGVSAFTIAPGSRLTLQVTATQAPSINAHAIALGGTLVLSPQGSLFPFATAHSTTFKDVFVADPPLSGSFAAVTTTAPFFTASVSPDATTPNALDATLTLNETALAASAQDLTQDGRLGLDAPRVLTEAVQDRLVANGGALGEWAPVGAASASANGAAGFSFGNTNVWARGADQFGTATASAASTGIGYDINRAAPLIAGIDWRLANGIVTGVAATYVATSAKFKDGSSTNVSSYQGAAYAGWAGGPWYAFGSVVASFNEFGTSRLLTPFGLPGDATSSPSGQSYQGHAEAGYHWGFPAGGVNLSVTPYAALDYVNAHVDGFSETGGFGALSVNATDSNSFQTTVGVRLTSRIGIANAGTLIPELRLGWNHEFLDASQKITAALVGVPGSTFTSTGILFGRDAALVGAGFSLELSPDAKVFVDYDGRLGSRLQEHSVSGGLRVRF